jgi:hypothetical protein
MWEIEISPIDGAAICYHLEAEGKVKFVPVFN